MTPIPTTTFHTGRTIPVLGLGTWLIGGGKTKDPHNDDKKQMQGLHYALEKGYSFIRTAPNYAEGYCEEIVGKVISHYERKHLFIASCLHESHATKKGILKNAQASLKRLGIDYFDLYLVGAPNPEISLRETADGLMNLLSLGITKDIGLSNFRLEELKIIEQYTDKSIIYNEAHYNLVLREPELNGVLTYCQENNILLCAYRPLQLFCKDVQCIAQLAQSGIVLLNEMSKKYGKSQAQIALKWLLSKNGVITIVKAITLEHIDENISIFDWELKKEDIESLDKDFPIKICIGDCSPPKKFIP